MKHTLIAALVILACACSAESDFDPNVCVEFLGADGPEPYRVPFAPGNSFSVLVSACADDVDYLTAKFALAHVVGEPDAGGGTSTIRLRPGSTTGRCADACLRRETQLVGTTTLTSASRGETTLYVEAAGIRESIALDLLERPDEPSFPGDGVDHVTLEPLTPSSPVAGDLVTLRVRIDVLGGATLLGIPVTLSSFPSVPIEVTSADTDDTGVVDFHVAIPPTSGSVRFRARAGGEDGEWEFVP